MSAGTSETLITAPRKAQPKVRQAIQHGGHGFVRRRLQHNAKQTRCTRKIALPERVTGIVVQCGIKDARNLRNEFGASTPV